MGTVEKRLTQSEGQVSHRSKEQKSEHTKEGEMIRKQSQPFCDYTKHSTATNYDIGMKAIPTIVSKKNVYLMAKRLIQRFLRPTKHFRVISYFQGWGYLSGF